MSKRLFLGVPKRISISAGLTLVLLLVSNISVNAQLSGNVTLDAVGLEGVSITLTGGTYTGANPVLTDVDGNYLFNGTFQNGNRTWTITPSLAGYTFDPVQRTFTQNLSNTSLAGQNFTATVAVGAASAATSLITADPLSIVANGASTSTITVQLKDANGNNLTIGGDTVTLGTNLGTLSGVATFSGLSIDAVGVGYTLRATSTGLTLIDSNTFNIEAATFYSFATGDWGTPGSWSLSEFSEGFRSATPAFNAAAPALVFSLNNKAAGGGFVGKQGSESEEKEVPVISIMANHSDQLQSVSYFMFTERGNLN